jgi:peptidoglycan hydrolase-like protein with peptidoglycan-binding domain
VAGGAVAVARTRHDQPAPPAAASAVATATVRRTDLAATQLVNATLGFAPSPPVIVRRQGTYTWLPAEGSTVEPGQAVAAVDGRPVMMLNGATGAWRAFGPGMTDGDDVTQLEQGLVALGFGAGLTVDRHFSAATATAIRRWQASLGERRTGVVTDGDVIFLPGHVRVGTATTAVGAPAAPGQAPYAVTSTSRVVHADLDAARQEGVTAGAAVTVDLPGGARAPGTIASLGTVATTAAADGANGSQRPTVPLTVTLDDPTAGGSLDQQPVQIELVTDSRSAVLAVPVTALLALAEGGYGVEVVPSQGPHTIVTVTPGLFASGLVEITSGSVHDGDVVVVAK